MVIPRPGRGLHPSEREFQKAVIGLAQQLHWRVVHFRPARTATGWRTPVEGDGEGFPDLILVRDRVVAAELKVGAQQTTAAQRAWLVALARAGVETYLWKPMDLMDGRVLAVLRQDAKP